MRRVVLLLSLSGLLCCLSACNLERQESIKIANKGVQSLNQGDFEVSLGYLKKALLKDPTNANAANLMGQIYFHDLRNNEEAKKAFLVALDARPNHLDTLYRMGWLHIETKKYPEAQLYLQSCIEHDAEHGHCHYFLGKIAESKNDMAGANKRFRESIRLEPRSARGFTSLADLYIEVRAISEAIEVLEESIRLNPDDADSRQKLGSLLLQRGDPSRAAQLFLDAAQLSPQEHELLFAVGSAYVQSQETKAASHFLARYLAKPHDGRKVIRPNEEVARVMLENLRRGPRLMAPVSEDSEN